MPSVFRSNEKVFFFDEWSGKIVLTVLNILNFQKHTKTSDMTFCRNFPFRTHTHIFLPCYFFVGRKYIACIFQSYVPYIIAFALKILHTYGERKNKYPRQGDSSSFGSNKNILQVHEILWSFFPSRKYAISRKSKKKYEVEFLILKLLSPACNRVPGGKKRGEREFRAPTFPS